MVLTLQPSRQLVFAFSAAHVGTIAVLWATAVPTPLKGALALCIAVTLVRSLRRHALLLARPSIISVTVLEDSTLRVDRRNGTTCAAAVLGTSYVSPILTVLNMKMAGARLEHVLIVPDNVDPEAFRRLRVLLRWRARAAQQ